MGFKENLKRIRNEKDLTQKQLADMLGVERSAVTQWETGWSEPKMGRIEDLAKALSVNKSQLIEDAYYPVATSFVDRPLYGSIAAGTPLEMLPVDDTYPAPKPIVDRYPDGFWLRISSDSMDLLFPVGTLVYVNPKEDVDVNGKPYALCVNGYDATVKICDKLDNGYKLTPMSTDPTYKAKVYDYSVPGTDRITSIGEIVYDMKPFDWSY